LLASTTITVLPPEIGQLTNLQILNLSNTNLTELPPEIGQLTSLSLLELGHSPISELPLELGQLPNLRGISLDATITEVPPWLQALPNLSITLDGTPLIQG
jgi:internalin A